MFGKLKDLFVEKPAEAAPVAAPDLRRAPVLKGPSPASRTELLRQAMAIHRAKQEIFAGLTEEQREKLTALAFKKLLNQHSGPDGER